MNGIAIASRPRAILQGVGSLWIGTVLLVLLVIAMACATVFESMHGPQRALVSFYRSWWFLGLVALLGVNIAAATVLRYPFSRRHIGFVLTHSGILIILAGAIVTQLFGVEGRIGLAQGESTSRLTIPEDTLVLKDLGSAAHASTSLRGGVFGGFSSAKRLDGPDVSMGNVRVEIDAYEPDTIIAETVQNDAPQAHPAVEVSLHAARERESTWLFPGQRKSLGLAEAVFRVLTDEELQRALEGEIAPASPTSGTIRVDHGGKRYETSLESCTDQPVALGDTKLTLRLLRYLPRAAVDQDNHLVNASSGPLNPAIEVEIESPAGTERRIAFADFSDFKSMHDASHGSDVNVTFVRPTSLAPLAPIEVLSGSGAEIYVRFAWEGTAPVIHKLVPGVAVDAPWPGRQFTLLQRLDRARLHRSISPVDPIRKQRVPAVHVRVLTPDDSFETWIRRDEPGRVDISGSSYELSYTDADRPLGFNVTLDQFRVGYYPGGQRPRSFESRVTLVDPATGRNRSRVISMNHPTSFGGYTFYQSSYYSEANRTVSVLSVSRDIGQPVVFVGYFATMGGMLVVLLTRARERRFKEVSE